MSYNSNNRGNYYALRYLSNNPSSYSGANHNNNNHNNYTESNGEPSARGGRGSGTTGMPPSSYKKYMHNGSDEFSGNYYSSKPSSTAAQTPTPAGAAGTAASTTSASASSSSSASVPASYANGPQQGMSRSNDRDFHSGYRNRYSKYSLSQSGNRGGGGNVEQQPPSVNSKHNPGSVPSQSYGGYSRSHYLRNGPNSSSYPTPSQANKPPVSRKYDRYDPSKKTAATAPTSNQSATNNNSNNNFHYARLNSTSSGRDFRDERRNGGSSFYSSEANANIPLGNHKSAGSSYTPQYGRSSYGYRDFRRDDGPDSGGSVRDRERDVYRDMTSRNRDQEKERESSIYRDRERRDKDRERDTERDRDRDRDRDRGRRPELYLRPSTTYQVPGNSPPHHYSQESSKGSSSGSAQSYRGASSTPPHYSYYSTYEDLKHRKERAQSLGSPDQTKSQSLTRRNSNESGDDKVKYVSRSTGSSRRNSTNVTITDSKLLHLFDEDFGATADTTTPAAKDLKGDSSHNEEEEVSANEVLKSESTEKDLNSESSTLVKKKSFGAFMKEKQTKAIANQPETIPETPIIKESNNEGDNLNVEPIKTATTSINTGDSASIDSSILSPVGDASMDDPFYLELDTLREEDESKEAKNKTNEEKEKESIVSSPTSGQDEHVTEAAKQDDYNLHSDFNDEEHSASSVSEDESEAETIPSTSPVKPSKGRRLIRKKEYDENREKLKAQALKEAEETVLETPVFESSELSRSNGKSSSRSLFKPYKIKRDSGGRSLLQRACKKGNLEEIQNYVERGASVNESDFCGFTCLHEAALEGHDEVVRYLLERGADVNAQASDVGAFETPLIDAAENKHTEVVRILLEHNADPTIFNIDGFSALTKIQNDHDEEEGYDEIIALLENAIATKKEKFGVSKEYMGSDGIKLPLDKKSGSKRNLSGAGIEDPTDNYFSDLIKKKKIYKRAAEGDKEFTADFITTGHQLNQYPDLVIIAARNGHTELIDIVLGLNFDVYDIDHENSIGLTALLASVGRGHVDTVKSLLSKGADPLKVRKQDGFSVLEIAKSSVHYSEEEVRMLQKAINRDKGEHDADIKEETQTSRNENEVYGDSEEEEVDRNEDMEAQKDGLVAEDDGDKFTKKQNGHEEILRKRKHKNLLDDEDENDNDEQRPFSKKSSKESSAMEIDEEMKPTVGITESRNTSATPPPAVKDTHGSSPRLPSSSATHLRRSSIGSHLQDTDLYLDDDRPRTEDEFDVATSREPTPGPGVLRRQTMSPSPLTVKAQEELKAKNAEEIRLYQEKKEDKRKQKKFMFLKLEKEKEIKRKEEEKLRAEQEKKLEAMKREEEKRLALMAKEKSKQIEKQRNELRHNYIISQYPKGLQAIQFDRIELPEDVVQRYLPLYLFSIRDQLYILDLHLALLTACPFSDIGTLYEKKMGIQLDSNMKSRIWNLYFMMIGIDMPGDCYLKSEFVDGDKKFQKLVLTFIPFNDNVEDFIRSHCPKNGGMITDPHNINTVNLDEFCTSKDSATTASHEKTELDLDGNDVEFTKEVIKSRFVPPKLRNRKDSLRASYSVGTLLW